MKNYKEWSHLSLIEDKQNPFSTLYLYENGDQFYIEPIFYSYFESLIIHYPDQKETILQEMERIVRRNHKVIFSGMDEEVDEEPLIKCDDFIIITIYDITDRLGLYVEYKSRGSDYGD